MSENNISQYPILGAFYTMLTWASATVTFSIEHLDVILRIILSCIGIATGIMAGINWYWSIKKNMKIVKDNIKF